MTRHRVSLALLHPHIPPSLCTASRLVSALLSDCLAVGVEFLRQAAVMLYAGHDLSERNGCDKNSRLG